MGAMLENIPQEAMEALVKGYVRLRGISLAPKGAEVFDFEDAKLDRAILKRGDHIVCRIRHSPFYHHAMYMGGDSSDVIHVVDNNPEGNIQCRLWSDFCKEYRHVKKLFRVRYDVDQDIISRACDVAMSFAGKQLVTYNVAGANCQSFVVFCYTGEWCDTAIAKVLQACDASTLTPDPALKKKSAVKFGK
jgi:hypothetical protein